MDKGRLRPGTKIVPRSAIPEDFVMLRSREFDPPDQGDISGWRKLFDECDGVAATDEVNILPSGSMILFDIVEDLKDCDVSVNPALMRRFQERRIRLLEA